MSMITSANVYGVQPPSPQPQPTPVQEAVSTALDNTFMQMGKMQLSPTEHRVGDFKTRVIGERSELDAKRILLREFMVNSPIYRALSSEEKERLIKQSWIMEQYSNILTERILAFPQ